MTRSALGFNKQAVFRQNFSQTIDKQLHWEEAVALSTVWQLVIESLKKDTNYMPK
jgi:hypothetical protein